MVLHAKTKLIQSPNSSTQYVTIPADVVKDSQYPFSANQEMEIRIIPGSRRIEIIATEVNSNWNKEKR